MQTRGLARPLVIGLVVVLTAAAAGTTIVARGDSGRPRRPAEQSYQKQSPRSEVQQRSDGTWASPLLPFAGAFPDRAAAERAVQEARHQGLVA